MTLSRISIEYREAADGFGHMYLVARTSAQTNGFGSVIDGESSNYPGGGGTLEVDLTNGAGVPLEIVSAGSYEWTIDSSGNLNSTFAAGYPTIDYYHTGDTETSRHDQSVTTSNVDSVWGSLETLANSINSADFEYSIFGTNSNTLITTLLSYIGQDVSTYISGSGLTWTGTDILLSTEIASSLCGFGGDDIFYSKNGGVHTFNGGDGNSGSLVPTNTSDGIDTVEFIDAAGVSFSLAGSPTPSHWNAVETLSGSTYTDTLYSIERAGTGEFSTTNLMTLEDRSEASATFRDETAQQIADFNTALGVSASDMVDVSLGTSAVTVFNVGSFIGSAIGGDEFDLNQQIGRSFTGGGDGTNANTISYAGIADAGGMTIDLDQELAWLNSSTTLAGPPTIGADTIENFQNAVGSAYDDLIVGTDAVNTLTGGLGDDTLIGGSGADTCYGGAGNDLFRAAASDDATPVFEGDSYDGGTGIDTLDCSHLNHGRPRDAGSLCHRPQWYQRRLQLRR